MLQIHQAIQAGGYPNATTLASQLEVCTKSIHRDLEFMRDRLDLPIQYDGRRFGYFYTEPVKAFPTLQITEGELFALVVAERALQQYRGTNLRSRSSALSGRWSSPCPATISLSLSDVEQTISFRTSSEPILDLQVFDTLAKATTSHRQLEITYRKPGQQQSERRVVDPYHLANINGEWFLFAYDHLRNDLRTFVPARIKTIQPTGKTFERRKNFSLKERLRGSFGVQSGKGEFHVVIRFHKP